MESAIQGPVLVEGLPPAEPRRHGQKGGRSRSSLQSPSLVSYLQQRQGGPPGTYTPLPSTDPVAGGTLLWQLFGHPGQPGWHRRPRPRPPQPSFAVPPEGRLRPSLVHCGRWCMIGKLLSFDSGEGSRKKEVAWVKIWGHQPKGTSIGRWVPWPTGMPASALPHSATRTSKKPWRNLSGGTQFLPWQRHTNT